MLGTKVASLEGEPVFAHSEGIPVVLFNNSGSPGSSKI